MHVAWMEFRFLTVKFLFFRGLQLSAGSRGVLRRACYTGVEEAAMQYGTWLGLQSGHWRLAAMWFGAWRTEEMA